MWLPRIYPTGFRIHYLEFFKTDFTLAFAELWSRNSPELIRQQHLSGRGEFTAVDDLRREIYVILLPLRCSNHIGTVLPLWTRPDGVPYHNVRSRYGGLFRNVKSFFYFINYYDFNGELSSFSTVLTVALHTCSDFTMVSILYGTCRDCMSCLGQ